MDAKLNMDFSNEMLLNTAKCQGYSFYRFRVIKGKPSLEEGGGGGGGGLNFKDPSNTS